MRWALYVTLSPLWFDPGEVVGFSFHRYKGSKILHEKVREVAIVDPYRVRFHLHEPWPDFMTFYGTLATGAGWVVPKRYVEQVGNAGFKKQPVGLGPYKFVSHTSGVELVMEAFEGYWCKVPHVKRLVIIPCTFEFALPIEPYPYDPAKAKRLLAEAGYPNGSMPGNCISFPPTSRWGRRSWGIWGPWGSG